MKTAEFVILLISGFSAGDPADVCCDRTDRLNFNHQSHDVSSRDQVLIITDTRTRVDKHAIKCYNNWA